MRSSTPGPPLHAQSMYVGMMLALVGLAIAFDSLWPLVTLVPFGLVIRYGVVARRKLISSACSARSIAAIAPACSAGRSAVGVTDGSFTNPTSRIVPQINSACLHAA